MTDQRFTVIMLVCLGMFFGSLLFAAGIFMPKNEGIIGVLGTLAGGAGASLYTYLKQGESTKVETSAKDQIMKAEVNS